MARIVLAQYGGALFFSASGLGGTRCRTRIDDASFVTYDVKLDPDTSVWHLSCDAEMSAWNLGWQHEVEESTSSMSSFRGCWRLELAVYADDGLRRLMLFASMNLFLLVYCSALCRGREPHSAGLQESKQRNQREFNRCDATPTFRRFSLGS